MDGARLLEIVTLNVWGLPFPLSLQRGRRFSRIANWFERHPPDFCGLQEVWRSRYRSLSLPGLRLPDTRGDTGLAVAGRLSEAAVLGVEHFRASAGFDAFKSKGLLLAQVGPLTVGVTHLQASPFHAAVRARQIEEIVAICATVSGPLVLMGDFNFHREQPQDTRSASRLADVGFVDAAEAVGRAEPTWIRRNPFVRAYGTERFDRIYLRGAVEPVRVEAQQRILSDHLPLRAVLRVSP